MFVMTNKGIQVMKMVEPELQCLKCQNDKFCPMGPIPAYQISYEDIETIVKFP